MDGTGAAAGTGAPRAPSVGEPLFRAQVLREQQTQWLGTILLKPRPAHRWFAACAALITTVIVSILFTASYTKKARVNGWLVPREGMVRVFAPRAAVATRLLVREGDEVRMGQALLALSTEEQSTALGDTQAHAAHTLETQRASLDAEKERTEQLFRQQRASLAERIAATESEQQHMEQEIALQKSRLGLARQSELRMGELQARGFISAQQVQTAAEAGLEQAGKLRALERALISLGRERSALEGERQDLPLKLAAQHALIARGLAGMSRELAEVEARRELLISAPHDGTVTAIHASIGDAVHPGSPLLSIVPRGATLEAHLYAPSRSIGFVRVRQAVLLRYQAYPYQKFGHYRGVITSISRTGIGPAELPAQFATQGGAGQSLYRITVALARQDITAYGAPVPLQSGMQLEADVILERRRLIEWVLEPVFTLTGKWTL